MATMGAYLRDLLLGQVIKLYFIGNGGLEGDVVLP